MPEIKRRRVRLNRANAERADRARTAAAASCCGRVPDWYETTVDLLTELRHLARAEGFSFAGALASSRMHHEAERGRGDDIERVARARREAADDAHGRRRLPRGRRERRGGVEDAPGAPMTVRHLADCDEATRTKSCTRNAGARCCECAPCNVCVGREVPTDDEASGPCVTCETQTDEGGICRNVAGCAAARLYAAQEAGDDEARAGRVSDLCTRAADPVMLGEAELLELTTGCAPATATRALAGRALRGVLSLTDAEAKAVGFVAEERARLRALASLVQRAASEVLVRGARISGGADVFRHFHASMRELKVEQFRVVLLDGKHRVMREVLVSQGTLTSSPVHPRETFVEAVRFSAAAVVLVHNHPSGDPSPSADDLEITHRLAAAGDLIGIRVLDHVIIGDGAYVSLADRGLLR